MLPPSWSLFVVELPQVDLPCKGGKTALMMACALGREAVVQDGTIDAIDTMGIHGQVHSEKM